MSFPLSPSNGQLAILNGINYIWNTSKNAWVRVQTPYITGFNVALETANTSYALATAAFSQSNNNSILTQSAYNSSNTNSSSITLIQGVDAYQNTRIAAVDAYATSGYGVANGANILAQAAFNSANSGSSSAFAYAQANAANNLAQSAYNAANTGTTATSAYTQANAANNLAQAAFNAANTGTTAASAYTQANAATTSASASFVQANAATNSATAAYGQANAATTSASAGYTQANAATVSAQAAYNSSNTNATAITLVQGVDVYQNTRIAAVDAYATSGYGVANASNGLAQAAYNKANTGGTITGSVNITQDLTVTGNLSVLGTSTTITATTLDIGDSLIYLANNNLLSDTVDIGIIGHYNDGANAHAGIIRDPNLKEWIFFKGYTPEVQSNNLINISHPSFAYSNVYSGWFKGNLIGTSVTVNGTDILSYSTGAYTLANATNNLATSGYAVANASNNLATSGYLQANAATISAQAAYNKANGVTSGFLANSIIIANSTGYLSNSSNLQYIAANNTLIFNGTIAGTSANTTITAGSYVTTFDNFGRVTVPGPIVFVDGTSQNTAYSNASVIAAYAQANAATNSATAGYTQANAATNSAQTGFNKANDANILASAAYAAANTGTTAVAAFTQANAATVSAQAAYNNSNTKTFIFYQNTAPSSANSRDEWVNSDTGSRYQNIANATPLWVELGPTTAVTESPIASAGFDKANVAYTVANAASIYANTAITTSGGSIIGSLNVTFQPATTVNTAVVITAANTVGGTGYADVLKFTNSSGSATNRSKTFRLTSIGNLEIVNSAYSQTILGLTDGGNLTLGGSITPTTWTAGQVIKDTMLDNTQFTVPATTVATSTSDTDFISYSYTPVSSSSYLIIHVHVSSYDAGTTSGTGNDSYFSRIKVDGTEITYSRQATRDNFTFRSGTLFPLTGRYTNSNTATKSITVGVRRDTADDSITITNSATALWMRITEVAR